MGVNANHNVNTVTMSYTTQTSGCMRHGLSGGINWLHLPMNCTWEQFSLFSISIFGYFILPFQYVLLANVVIFNHSTFLITVVTSLQVSWCIRATVVCFSISWFYWPSDKKHRFWKMLNKYIQVDICKDFHTSTLRKGDFSFYKSNIF